MYVFAATLRVKEGEEQTFIEMQKFVEKTEAKPAGLDHYHIFQDRWDSNKFFLVEYWQDKKHRDAHVATEDYQNFLEYRKLAVEKDCEQHEFDVII
jgi:quinol monooxygenase YgiN